MKEDTSETTRSGWSFWLEKASQSLKRAWVFANEFDLIEKTKENKTEFTDRDRGGRIVRGADESSRSHSLFGKGNRDYPADYRRRHTGAVYQRANDGY